MIKAGTRPWGNSVGIVIPKDIIKELGIKPHEEIMVDIHKKSGTVLKELFGTLKWKKPIDETLREARKEWESKFGA